MSKQTSPKIVKLSDYKGQAAAQRLYSKHDRYIEDAASKDPDTGYSEVGLSILDDIDYFLMHREFRAEFERVFQKHLYKFSMEMMKGYDDE